ncbi:MAG: hypothetical protein JRG70_16170 [Deltaproteobacteria bacterium]|nr:hypothetical protein [Deltaproteobacteria bacterium]
MSWLRTELDKRRAACRVSCKWKPEYETHLEAVVQQALEAKGNTRKILTGALDGLFADPTQLKYRYSPAALVYGFDKYAAPILEQEAAQTSASKRAEKDAEYERIKAEYDARAEVKRLETRRPQQPNGTPNERGAEPVAIAELVPPIGAKLGRT